MPLRLARKIGAEHPTGVVQGIGDELVPVLAKGPIYLPVFFVEFAGEVHPAVVTLTEFLQVFDGGGEVGVSFELFLEDGGGGPDIGECVVGAIEGLSGVALVRFFEAVAVDVALDLEDVDKPGAGFGELHAGTGSRSTSGLHEHGHVEVVGIIASEVAAGEPPGVPTYDGMAMRRKSGASFTSSSEMPWTAVAAAGMGTLGLTRTFFSSRLPSGLILMAPIWRMRSVEVLVPVVSRSKMMRGRWRCIFFGRR